MSQTRLRYNNSISTAAVSVSARTTKQKSRSRKRPPTCILKDVTNKTNNLSLHGKLNTITDDIDKLRKVATLDSRNNSQTIRKETSRVNNEL